MSGRSLTASFGTRARQWLMRQGGQLLRRETMDPAFLVVGGKRCGSTTLHDRIMSHPDVLAPLTAKSSHYFDVNYSRGARWYAGHFPSVAQAARHAKSAGATPVTGESSPYYSFHPLSAERIAADLPEAHLILCVRNPIERTWSQYQYNVQRGFEDLPFRAALDAEDERLVGQAERVANGEASPEFRHQTYLARGRYIEHVEHMAAHVDRSQIHVVIAEELFSDPDTVLNNVWGELGLRNHPVESVPKLKATAKSKTTLAPGDREWLTDYFLPYNERLAAWLGRTVLWSEQSQGSTR